VDNFGTLDDGQLFMMVPFLDGEPLDAYLHKRGGRLAPYRALHLVVQICDALDYAHARGVIHRDLKPGNVFIVSTNENPYLPKLLDFGICRLPGHPSTGVRTQSGVAIGTPGYMAVEQYEHADEVTPAADVYALAVMTWEIVTGRRPWDHPDCAVLYFQQRTVIPERPPIDVMPAAWTDELHRALSTDPAARPSARELAVALASALPAIGRVPSGAEILSALAPHFVRKAAPDDDTVRNASDVDRIGPLLWPPRETEVGVWEAPANAPAVPAEEATTLTAATGVVNVTNVANVTIVTIERRRRWKLALAGIGTAALAALGTSVLASRVTTRAASRPPEPAAAAARIAIPEPAAAAARTARPEPVPEAARIATPSPARASSPEPGGQAPVPRSGTKATAPHAPSPMRDVAGAGTEPSRAEPGRNDARRSRKPVLVDPDDVVGPEL
jgi:eukaryotic-like serine/threonine-protein kinase